MKKFFILVVLTALSTLGTAAQTEKVTAEVSFFGNVPTVVKLPLPQEDPKIVMSGTISVLVKVDETGAVSVADGDAEGPYPICKNVTNPKVLALRASAIAAARRAKFSPAIVESRPVAASGRINYRFEAQDSDQVSGLASSSSGEMRLDRITKLGTTDSPVGVKVVDPNEKSGTAAIVYPDGKKPSTVSGGVLNGKATSLPKPSYPAAAMAVRAGGAVSVQVLIYEDGTVYTATAVSGHPLLRRASEIAACSAAFMPVLLEGTPVKVSGVITYNFVP